MQRMSAVGAMRTMQRATRSVTRSHPPSLCRCGPILSPLAAADPTASHHASIAPLPSRPFSSSSSSSYEASIPRGTRIQPYQKPTGGPSRGSWAFLAGAVALLGAYLIGDWWWMRSDRKRLLDARSSRPGFPLQLLLAMREARLAQEQAEEDLARLERSTAATAERQQQQQQQQQSPARFRASPAATATADPLAQTSISDAASESVARSIVSAAVPSLLEAERLYRSVLSTHLSWRPIDLVALRTLVESGSPTAQQALVGEGADAGTRNRARKEIDEVMDAGVSSKIDRAVLPYVLSLLAHNLHCQARVMQLQQSVGADGGDPAATAAATALRFRQAEQAFLQSLSLYRHHFAFDPRPYSVGVLQHLGTLYHDAGDRVQAERVWMRAQQMLAAARRALGKWQQEQQQRLDEMQRSVLGVDGGNGGGGAQQQQLSLQSELTDPAVVASFSGLASDLSEKLALLHRERGDYESAVAWTQDALREWDEHAAQQRARGGRPLGGSPSSPGALESAQSPAASPAVVALRSLPRAMHLLTALAADLAQMGQARAALDACSHSLQVLERVVDLEARARGIPAPAPSDDSAELQDQGAQAHQAFLSPLFTERLLQLLQSAPADPADAAAAALPIDLEELRGEAAAAYYNLSVLLRALQSDEDTRPPSDLPSLSSVDTQSDSPASTAATRASPDAKRAMQISRQLASSTDVKQFAF